MFQATDENWGKAVAEPYPGNCPAMLHWYQSLCRTVLAGCHVGPGAFDAKVHALSKLEFDPHCVS